ncbi:MAG: hypothetical protein LKF48_07515 [Prevotella sp.]|nr:hypothetical protein [Prevotella sp.]MCH4182987.1 hypothetical protein [Prevotella sp.]
MAKSLMFEKKTSKDYDGYYMPWINKLLIENFDLNNARREFKGKDPLDTCQTIKLDSDVLEFEDEITRDVLPYGLASKFFIDDDESKYDIFNTDYQNAQVKYMCAIEKPITDVYGGGDY